MPLGMLAPLVYCSHSFRECAEASGNVRNLRQYAPKSWIDKSAGGNAGDPERRVKDMDSCNL